MVARASSAPMIALSLGLGLVLALGTGCKKKDPKSGAAGGPAPGAAASATNAVPKATLTPDVKPVDALLADPELVKGTLVGTRVKVHGYALAMSPSKVAVTAEAAVSVPFIACLGTGLPAGVPSRAHVLAEGRIDPTGQLADCTLSPL